MELSGKKTISKPAAKPSTSKVKQITSKVKPSTSKIQVRFLTDEEKAIRAIQAAEDAIITID